jgi:hypothetical protein
MGRLILLSLFSFCLRLNAQNSTTAPNVSQVLMYSAITPTLTVPTLTGAPSFTLPKAVPSIFTETIADANPANASGKAIIVNAANYSVSRNFVQLNNALNASIATSLSIIPLSSPASGVITRTDPDTGAELPVSSTLGPIFTERAETIGKGKFYLGFSNQGFHFTSFNGTSLNSLSLLYQGGDPSKVIQDGNQRPTVPATFALGMDVRLSQNIAFLTYGVTNSLDVSLGLPVIHSAVSARTYNGTIYSGTGFDTHDGSTCWCVNTFTPGYPTLMQQQIGQTALGKTGLGDVLLRVKGTVIRESHLVVAVGSDVRFPTGDANNYLGVGTTTVKPFAAVSFYSKPLRNNIVLSPHFDVGWQFSGKSILGGQLQGTALSQNTSVGAVNYIGAPFTYTKGYLPDVFTWAAGTEIALGRHNTLIADILGNQVGWIHGIPNATFQTLPNQLLPTGPNGNKKVVPVQGSAVGLVGMGNVSFGQYTGSFGYKARLMGNLVASFNVLTRFDDNGLTARLVPLYGLGYTF